MIKKESSRQQCLGQVSDQDLSSRRRIGGKYHPDLQEQCNRGPVKSHCNHRNLSKGRNAETLHIKNNINSKIDNQIQIGPQGQMSLSLNKVL